MKFIKLFNWETKDPVRTEEIILKNLKNEKLQSDFLIADHHWADTINNEGLEMAQNKIYNFLKRSDKRKIIFICQHISGKDLDWKNNIVFSPHATSNDNFIPIPHYSCVYSSESKKKDIDASFVGSYETHRIRHAIGNLLKNKNKYFVKDTGTWHFYNKNNKKEREAEYKNIMSRSNIVICPRGTGPGSIRVWDALSSNVFPLIISDSFELPKIYKNLIPVLNLESVILIEEIIQKLISKNFNLNKRMKKIFNIHEKKTNNKNLHKLIIDYIKVNK
jgi:hypothetical protein